MIENGGDFGGDVTREEAIDAFKRVQQFFSIDIKIYGKLLGINFKRK